MPFSNPKLLEEYKLAIDSSTIVSKSDKYGNIIYVNDEFCKVSKFSREELIGKPHNILRHEDMPKEAFKELWSTIKAGKIWRGIVKNKAKDGSSYWVNTVVSPIKNDKDEIIEYISIRSEITDVVNSKERIKNLLEKFEFFVPLDFINILQVEDITEVTLGHSIEKELTILFCDIRNFTNYSESLTSEQIFYELNQYFSFIVPAITRSNGFIDKYIGDAIMALFYSPEDSIKAANSMLNELKELNKQRALEKKSAFDFGIGINTGKVTLGTVGNNKRLDTTVIGDSVNLASRLEGLNKKLKTKVLISESTYKKIQSKELFEDVGMIKVKGKDHSVRVYKLLNG